MTDAPNIDDALMKTLILDSLQSMAYRDIYLPVVRCLMQDNKAYLAFQEEYHRYAKALSMALKATDQKAELASLFQNKSEVFKRVMETMRELANFEAAELIKIIRYEHRTGVFVTELLKSGESFESIAARIKEGGSNESNP